MIQIRSLLLKGNDHLKTEAQFNQTDDKLTLEIRNDFQHLVFCFDPDDLPEIISYLERFLDTLQNHKDKSSSAA